MSVIGVRVSGFGFRALQRGAGFIRSVQLVPQHQATFFNLPKPERRNPRPEILPLFSGIVFKRRKNQIFPLELFRNKSYASPVEDNAGNYIESQEAASLPERIVRFRTANPLIHSWGGTSQAPPLCSIFVTVASRNLSAHSVPLSDLLVGRKHHPGLSVALRLRLLAELPHLAIPPLLIVINDNSLSSYRPTRWRFRPLERWPLGERSAFGLFL